jgi:hypothetical protein
MPQRSAGPDGGAWHVTGAASSGAYDEERREPPAAGRLTSSPDSPVWPAVTMCLALLLAFVVAVDPDSSLRPIVALVFLSVVPGASLVPLIGVRDLAVQATLVVPVSFAVVALTSAALFYPRWWSAPRELAFVTLLSLAGYVLQLLEASRRRTITAGGTP